MFRPALLLALVLAPAVVAREPNMSFPSDNAPQSSLLGRVAGDQYYAPLGSYRMTIPLLPGLGGGIRDTKNVVEFYDPYSTYITVFCDQQDMAEKWKYESLGPKEYLQEFFYNYVWRNFAVYPGAAYDTNARFQPNMSGGALFTFITLPGGSMFTQPELQIDPSARPLVAKRGNMLFVHDGYVYVISTELAERVNQRDHYTLTDEEENILLRTRLANIANTLHFLPPPAAQ